jgi:enoyl-CoA hydratase
MRTTLEIKDDVARIVIDDGKVNAMSAEMLHELCARLDAARAGARATVLRGRPGIFSAGFDMPTFAGGLDASRKMVGAGMQTILRMLSHPHPIVVACTGHAYPMGAFLMLSADVRYGARGDYRIGMNEVQIGLTVPRFALELARHRLTTNGFAQVATGALFSPEDAVSVGYLDRVVAEEELFDEVDAVATRLLSINLDSYAATKARMHASVAETIRGLSDPAMLSAELIGLSNL